MGGRADESSEGWAHLDSRSFRGGHSEGHNSLGAERRGEGGGL